jgi:hypothetical protein
MSFSERLSSSDLQTFTFPRRELLGKLFSVAVATVAAKRSPESQSEFLKAQVLEKYPKAKFAIGDKVADYWIDEFNKECIEYGTVCGVCWHPNEEEWAYSIEWTSGGMPDFCYPCFDNNLTIGGDLRFAAQS